MLFVGELIWDKWNVEHIARHDVLPEEVEEVCNKNPFVSETHSGRLRLIGLTKNDRMLTIIVAPKELGTYYPVTARPASRKERRKYKEQKGGENYDTN